MERLGLRQRNIFKLQAVKALDAFPKIPQSYVETSAAGGGFSILVFVLITILVVSEFRYYSTTELDFIYEVDTELDGVLKMNIDMTVAMKCRLLTAAIVDVTEQKKAHKGNLVAKNVHYDLAPNQREHFDQVKNAHQSLMKDYHAIHKLLWQTGYKGTDNSMPKRNDTVDARRRMNGCRFHGTIELTKVAGIFYITAGKTTNAVVSGKHVQIVNKISYEDYNFSHRINHFSFGDHTGGKLNPLDGEEKTSPHLLSNYQYFVQVVPTNVRTTSQKSSTYQYAVNEKDRIIDHSKGSHGRAGIFVKYDLSPLKVTVLETHKSYWKFLIRLCGIVGGVFATSGIIHAMVGALFGVVCCRCKRSEEMEESPSDLS